MTLLTAHCSLTKCFIPPWKGRELVTGSTARKNHPWIPVPNSALPDGSRLSGRHDGIGSSRLGEVITVDVSLGSRPAAGTYLRPGPGCGPDLLGVSGAPRLRDPEEAEIDHSPIGRQAIDIATVKDLTFPHVGSLVTPWSTDVLLLLK